MLTVSLHEAKTRLSALLERAAAGEEIIIAKHGVARARLVPIAVCTTVRQCAASHAYRRGLRLPEAAIARLFAGQGP